MVATPVDSLKRLLQQSCDATEPGIRALGIYPYDEASLVLRFETRHLRSLENDLHPMPIVQIDGEDAGKGLIELSAARVTRGEHELLLRSYSLKIPRQTQGVNIILQRLDGEAIASLDLGVRSIRSLLGKFESLTRDASYDSRYPAAKRTAIAEPPESNSLVTVIVATPTPDPMSLLDTIDSLTHQAGAPWKAVIATSIEARDTALEVTTLLDDERVAYIDAPNGNLSGALNLAIRQASTEGPALFITQGDLLAPTAIASLENHISPDGCNLAYCDVDQVSGPNGTPSRPRFLPNFNRDLLYSRDYITTGFMISAKLLATLGKFPVTLDCAWSYELVLRASELSEDLAHVPKVLCHEGAYARLFDEKCRNAVAKQRQSALERHFQRRGLAALVMRTRHDGVYRSTFFPPAETPCVSIVIPNKDHVDYLKPCIESIREKAGYPNYEIVVVENNSTEDETFAFYQELTQIDGRVRVIRYDGPFNYSKIINFGARNSSGELLLLLNNDTRVITDNFLAILAGYFTRPEVGVVGPRLLFPDGLVQHAGLALFESGRMGFVNQNLSPELHRGYLDSLVCASASSAVLGACQMVRRSTFEEVGGYCEDLAITCNDIDFCWKVRKMGLDVVYTPHVELFHKEFGSRNNDDATSEQEAQSRREYRLIAERWPKRYEVGDGFINPNLNRESEYYKLA